jgi:sugar phosphate isomerase/epimerase
MKKRIITLVGAQWADLSFDDYLKKASEFGFDGVEAACWGLHIDPNKAATDKSYCKQILDKLNKYNLKMEAICSHIIGQCVGDFADTRLNNFAPANLADKPNEIRKWAIETQKNCAIAAKNLNVKVVTGFLGSPIWKYWYSFPQTSDKIIENGFNEIKELWFPILDIYRENGIKFALEVHPGEIAFDYYSTKRLLEVFAERKEFGLNFDPSHLLWQGIKPELFLSDFIDKVYHVHAKDVALNLDGRSGLLGSHIEFGSLQRGWNFVSLGRGDVDFEKIIRVLNAGGYTGPLSIEWEDSGMERESGAKEAIEFLRKKDFVPSDVAFDSAIAN